MSGPEADILPGNSLPLKNIPAGTVVHNIELKPGKGGQMARSAGAQQVDGPVRFERTSGPGGGSGRLAAQMPEPSVQACVHAHVSGAG